MVFIAACHSGGSADTDGGLEGDDGGIVTDDAGRPVGTDGGGEDAGGVDGDPGVDAGPTSADAGPDDTKLSMQGVYGDFATRAIPSDAIVYGVRYELWSDGATKRRWLLLPAGTQVDNSDQEHWRFPVGTRLVKEFTRDGVVVETRIEETLSSGVDLRTYVWNANHTEAARAIDGAFNIDGTAHDAPTAHECMMCHEGEPGGALAFSAIQLTPQMTSWLSAVGKLRVPIPDGTQCGPTGDPKAVAALTYLHANCGHCHQPGGYASTVNNQYLQLASDSRAANTEPGWISTVGVSVQGDGEGAGKRIDPGNPMNSAIIRRMSLRGSGQMPLIATEVVHAAGVQTVTDWVNTIAP
ncbi:hypothetical protein BH11MYX2_BH11MYX2_10450 [soil metagenome]